MFTEMEAAMRDPFEGTWTLNPGESQMDPNHRPTAGTMRWEIQTDGSYRMTAEGIDAKGRPCTERPQTLIPDGQPRPVPDFPGLTAVTTRPDPKTIRGQVKREDGSIVGEGTYVGTSDGRSLGATTAGFVTQLRRFETKTVWDRQ